MAIGTSNASPFIERYAKYPSEGLGIMFWDNNLGSYPRSGTSIKDLSGNGYDGTLNNFASPPTPTSGYNDGTIYYDGVDDYINFSRDWQTSDTEFTYFIIFRRTNAPNAAGSYTTTILTSEIGEQIKVGNFNQYWSPIVNINASLGIYTNNCFSGSETSVALDVNSKEFYQIAVCVKPGLIRTYFNGVLNDEQLIDIGPITDNRLKVSRLSSATIPASKWEGNIPVFMGYNKYLEQEEITQLYNYFNQVYNNDFFPPKLPETNLEVMFWDADFNSYPESGNTINDLSGNGNDGTLHNFANPPTLQSGFYKGTIYYDGAEDYISFPRTWLSVTTEFTLYVIFRRTAAPNAAGSYTTSIVTSEIGEQIIVGNVNQYWCPIIVISGSLGTYYNACWNGSKTNVFFLNNSKEYYHVAVCVKPNLIRTYVDGVLNDEQAIDIGPLTDLRRIPSRLSSESIAASKWEGNIPVFMAYEKFLEPDEITSIHKYFDRTYGKVEVPELPINNPKMFFWDNNPLCYPGSGVDLYDLSGNDNTAVMYNFSNPPTPTSGYYKGSIHYDGNNDFTQFKNSWLSGQTDFSLVTIAKMEPMPNAHGQDSYGILGPIGGGSYILINEVGSTETYTIAIFLKGSTTDFTADSQSGNVVPIILTDISKYFHIAVTVKTNEITLYINGIKCHQEIIDIGTLMSVFQVIGLYGSVQHFKGELPVVTGYDKCLTNTEAEQIFEYFDKYYNSDPINSFPTDDLQMMFWDKNQFSYPGSGTILYDLSGSNNDGAMSNFASPPTPISGYYNGTIHYDGDDDMVSFPDSWLSSQIDFTLAVVGKIEAMPNAHAQSSYGILGPDSGGSYILINEIGSTQTYSFNIYLDGSLTDFTANSQTGNVTPFILSDREKYFHLAITVKTNEITVYCNGELCHQQAVDIGSLSSLFKRIGRYGSIQYYKGLIPVVTGYNRCLSNTEIEKHCKYFNKVYNF